MNLGKGVFLCLQIWVYNPEMQDCARLAALVSAGGLAFFFWKGRAAAQSAEARAAERPGLSLADHAAR